MPGMRAPNMNLISPARLPQATPDMPPAQPGQIINPGATATREDEN
jgi:hypothetical protein